ncbi:MAG: prepilin-type N-terminal cleavage/methylation domain-containing protein [Opitutae bacterium]|jgi:prepilin-type N-terminal cleavage/methylation domain-containing protein|nr:prepilin-type N-terminal cleavage/methylation domain-containing protein [Opitutae bacterium]MBT4224669.1 prepilin-type N-terminal cleavage/methylation domain-containing protein [Opitutae bacterium]MBT6463255.1 prepilin-type N-terminal cleavage/methylation domain-containing protein [Opitutae bacterium]MBT7852869.1 prepilin-type N-terminal cleavage/methylation domain-containing protein [Opitutae bacterium]
MEAPIHQLHRSVCRQSRFSAGFTLVELLTVMSIIAMLATISYPLIGLVKDRQRLGRAKSDLDALGLALEHFKLTNNTYPEFVANNKGLSAFKDDARGYSDEKKSSEALFLALAGWHNEIGEELEFAGSGKGNDSRPRGYINLNDFKFGAEISGRELRKQLENLSANKPLKPAGIYFVDPWKHPYLYKYPILPNQQKLDIRRREDFVLLSKGQDRKISSSSSQSYNSKTWMSSEDAGLDQSEPGNDPNIDNVIQGPSPSG